MRLDSLAAPLYVAAALALAGALPSADLKPQTVAAFDRYVRLTEARIAEETAGRSPLLWLDRQAEPRKQRLLQDLQRGEVVVERLETRDGTRRIDAEDGLIHHWVGTVLLPGATLDKVIPFIQAYANYPRHFSPMIQRATVRSRDGDRFVVSMRTSMTKVVTVVLDADYTVEYQRLGPSRLFTRSITSNIFEVANAGKPSERLTTADKGVGYLWRLNTYCAFEARPEGTYEQCESISLTRGLPFIFGWAKPFITSIPRDTLNFTLGQVRKALK